MCCDITWLMNTGLLLPSLQIGKDRSLGFDPLFFSYYGGGEYTLVGGSNKRVLLCSRDGALLAHIGEEQTGWVWSCCYRPGATEGTIGGSVVMGTQDGKILLYRLGFSTVHGLYRDRYSVCVCMCVQGQSYSDRSVSIVCG